MLPWNKLKWEHNNPKSIGHSESSLKKVIHSITAVINTIRNERGEVTTDNKEITRIVRIYYKNLDANKLDNLEKMDKFLESYNVPKLSEEE